MLKVKQSGASNPAKECFSPSKVKKWAIDDLNKTVSWLESQEEKVFMFWFCSIVCSLSSYHLIIVDVLYLQCQCTT